MLPSDKWERVNELFQRAAECSPCKRAQFLVEACDGDDALRREVESLLEFDDRDGDFIETPAVALAAGVLANLKSDSMAGQRLGPYRLEREIAEGGMGAVYLASRADDEYRTQVAIKVVKGGFNTAEMRRRFRQERQILATLEHPNIARLLDGGTTEHGMPYLVMEYIEGVPVTRYCDKQGLAIEEQLKLFLTVCAAVSYAHRNLIIHRDLKPSNVLVTEEGTPKLLDFGIAKLLEPGSAEADGESHTVTQLGVMTPEYASPEQIRAEQVTTATDVYSLGVLLYELMTGQRPYRLTSRRPDEAARIVCEQEPTRPSEAIAVKTNSASVSSIPQSATRNPKSLRGDLDNIILRALRKEPERRYASVEQFAEDIRRHLEGLPVIARPDTFAYRSAKFVRRHKAGVAIAALVLIGLAIGLATVAWQARAAARERDVARREKAKAERINAFLQNILGFSDPSWLSTNPRRDREPTISQALDEAARRAETELADEPEVLAAVRFTIGYTYRVQSRFNAAEPHLRASLEIRRRLLGPAHQDTAQSMVGLGELLMLQSNYNEAAPLFREALAIYRPAFVQGTVDRKWFFIALNDYGLTQWFSGDLAGAEKNMLEALNHSAALTGNDRAAVAVLYGNIGLVRLDRGDLNGAAEYTQRAIDLHRSLAGGPRFELGSNLTNLAFIVMLHNDFHKAERLLREALDTYARTVGETHQYAAYSLILLADVSYRRGDYRQAIAEVNKALKTQQLVLPEAHLDFARSWVVLGKVLNRTGESARAESYLRQALASRMRALPGGHSLIAEVQGALGECLTTQRRYEEAEPLLIAGHSVYNSRFGRHDPRTLLASQRLVTLYKAWGNPDKAAPYR